MNGIEKIQDGGIISRYLSIVEYIDEDGDISLDITRSGDMKDWDIDCFIKSAKNSMANRLGITENHDEEE